MDARRRENGGGAVHVCFITDETYVLPTATAIESLKANKSPATRCEIHVICRDLAPESVALLRGLAAPGVAIDAITDARLPVGESRIGLVRHVSTSALFKFFIPDILPSLDKVLYIDDDVLVQGDLGEIWRTDVSGVYAGVVKDSQTVIGWEAHLKWLGFRHEAYFNSGVMLLNLALIRRDSLQDALIDYRIRGRNRFMDQDALNVVFGDRVRYLSIRCNCLNWLFHSCTIEQLKGLFGEDDVADTPEANYDRALILHIGGSEKPWLRELPYYTAKYRPYAERIGWRLSFPKVSVVVPVFNSAAHLRECLDSILGQTLREIDVVCVDNGSTDGSLAILEEYAKADGRLRVLKMAKKGAGRCRNLGIQRARGTYVGFVDSDDFVDADFFETLYVRAMKDGSDVCMSATVLECGPDGATTKAKNLGWNGQPVVRKVKDRGDLILASGVTWNKIYKNRFLAENAVRYSEEPCAGEDKVFGFGVLFAANRISVVEGPAYHYRQTGSGSESFRRKGRESFAIVGFHREVKEMLDAREMTPSAKATWRGVAKRCRDAEFRTFSNRMDPRLRTEFEGVCAEAFYDDFETTKRIDGLIVSLTSFPARIGTVHRTVKSILGQSVRPEKVVLYLAATQFPGRESDLPQELLALKPFGLAVKWCEDIRSYKKLIPALKHFPGDVIVTADDDCLYPRYWLEKLWQEHVAHPSDIIAHRLRRMERKGGRFLPYDRWPIVTKSVATEPYLALFTGVGGVLYPVACFCSEIFNRRTFMKLAPCADDIWFWAMAVLSRRRIRQVFAYIPGFWFVDGTQDVSLSHGNVEGGENDAQLRAVLRRYPEIESTIRREERRRALLAARDSLARLPGRCAGFAAEFLRQFAPYGAVAARCARRGKAIDRPLLHYRGAGKRIRRIAKFALPYGLVASFRRLRYGGMPGDARRNG